MIFIYYPSAKSNWTVKKQRLNALILLCFLFVALYSQAQPAFPGAEGFGSTTRGGRGGKLYFVTNLNDEGAGSFREACEAAGPRIVIFKVGGIITTARKIIIRNPYITIAGQTAPGDGICLRGAALGIATHDVIVRGLRIRIGDGPGPDPENRDGLSIANNSIQPYNIIIDHCSISWAIDENVQLWYPCNNITVQWCIISEGLHNSLHPKRPHSCGLLVGDYATNISVHHNLFAHNDGRSPLAKQGTESEVINNVIYNWGEFGATAISNWEKHDATISINIIGNYYVPGTNTSTEPIELKATERLREGTKVFVKDNIGPGRMSDDKDDWALVSGHEKFRVNQPAFPLSNVSVTSAASAYEQVIEYAGAIKPERDTVDKRIVQSVINKTGQIIDSQNDVGGWPVYEEGFPPVDSDNDGIPDYYEEGLGCNPDVVDSDKYNEDGYMMLEVYLNNILKYPAGDRFSVSLTAPMGDTTYYAPSQIVLEAEVTGNQHPITGVEFYNEGVLLGKDTAAPYTYTWTDIANGDHTLYAVATDSSGKTAITPGTRISVAPSIPPEVTLISPSDGEILIVPADLTISAEASDPDGTVNRVEFFINNAKVAEDTTSPYSHTLENAATGEYTIYVQATDDTDQTVKSDPVTVHVQRPLSYFEDFNDGIAQEWSSVAGEWEVQNDQYYNSTNLLSENCIYMGSTFALFEYSARLKPMYGNYFGMIFNYLDEENYYLLKMDASPSEASLIKILNGVESTLAERAYNEGGIELYSSVRVLNEGATTTVQINGDTVFRDIPTPDLMYGHIGLHTQVNYMWVDDVRVEADSLELHRGVNIHTGHEYPVALYPNPVTEGSFTITLPGKTMPAELTILDLKGRIIQSADLTEETTRIPVSILSSKGIYLIRTRSPAYSSHKKLVYMY